MDYHYILGGTLAFVVWLVLLYGSRRRNQREKFWLKNSLQHEKCESDMTSGITDIIVVGAGVAGSSLAYALGKVKIFSFPIISCQFDHKQIIIMYTTSSYFGPKANTKDTY